MTTAQYNPMTQEGIALLIKKQAHRYYRQVVALRLRDLDFEDVEQEMWMTWLKCLDNFDPQNEAGSQFVNYFSNAARYNLQRLFQRAVRDTVEIAPCSLQDFVDDAGDEFMPDFAMAADERNPERVVLAREALRRLWEGLSPLTQYVLALQLDPDEDVVAYFRARRAHREREMMLGLRQSHRELADVSLRDLMEYLNLPNSAYLAVLGDLEMVKRALTYE